MLQLRAPTPVAMVTGAPNDPPAGRVTTSPNRSLYFLIQPTTAAPEELTAALTWRIAPPAGVASMAGADHDPAGGNVALATLIVPEEESYWPHTARTLLAPSTPSATGPINDMPVWLTTTGVLHPADTVQTEDSITVSAERWANQAITTDPSGRATAVGEVAVWPAVDTTAVLDHPVEVVRTIALTRPPPVHATTAVPDTCPAVTSAGAGVPFTVPSVIGADHVVAALAAAGTIAPIATTPLASATASRRRNLTILES